MTRIRLLQIVYGADFQRVVLAGVDAGSKAKAVDPSLLDSDQQEFANKGSAAATQAAQLAQYVKQRANEAGTSAVCLFNILMSLESDLAKEKLSEQAALLNQKAKEFLAEVNKALQNPEAPASKEAINNAVLLRFSVPVVVLR